MDGFGNAYVTGSATANAFKITPSGTITEIIDSTGDGLGNTLDFAWPIALDASGNIYVGGGFSNNVLKIQAPSTVPALGPGVLLLMAGLLGLSGCRRVRVWRQKIGAEKRAGSRSL